MDYIKRAEEISGQIVADRRHLHQNPEFGMELPSTCAFVRSRLEKMGYTVSDCGWGLTATIGKGGKCVLLRADMDALKLTEENNLPYRSTNGYAHMCGHDMHTAILLGAAKLLRECESELGGTVKLMFQPGEEVMRGAQSMIDAGVLENPHVDAALGLHVMTHIANGKLSVRPSAAFAGIDIFRYEVKGTGGHGSALEMTVDPIHALVQVYNALESIVPRESSMFDSVSCSVGHIEGGTMYNTIPSSAMLEGTLRFFNNSAHERIAERMQRIADGVALATGTKCSVSHQSLPALVNDSALCAALEGVFGSIPGLEFSVADAPLNASEDFALVAERVPAVFLMLGVGVDGGVTNHNPSAVFYDDKLYLASAMLAKAAAAYLSM